MKRHLTTFIKSQPQATIEASGQIASALRERLGAAYYKDDDVLVWKLENGGAGSTVE
jgi:hypothetical protein